jgi:predicted PolB exonuclease-like 3'-5' exonuclease
MVDSTSIGAEIAARRAQRRAQGPLTAFLIFDTESVPDGRLIQRVKYPDEELDPEQAIARAQQEAREASLTGSDFLPVSFQLPIAICVLRVADDFSIQALSCLGAPEFRPEEMVRQFWKGVCHYQPRLVTFNGRGFDLPLLELAAFRYAVPARDYYQSSRNRYNGNHIDLFDWMSNYGACRLAGGLNLLAKLLGKPGKMGIDGGQVYRLFREGRVRDINDYCLFDVLDTYFVFLRTRVLIGVISPEQERFLVQRARAFITARTVETPVLRQYLERWEDGSEVASVAG